MATLTRNGHCGALARTWRLGLAPLLFAGFCCPAHALGVGEPQLLSSYAEPLRVRVPITLDTAEERGGAEAVHADLIPEEEYSHYGVAEQGVDLSAVYAASHSEGGRTWIEIGSTERMREPVAILLLRVRLGSTLIVKEVPLLFDLSPATVPAPAPAETETASAAEVNAVPLVPPPAETAAAPVAPAPARHHAHRQHRETIAAIPAPAAEAAAPAAPMFQLSPGLRYTSASAGLRLADRFDSLAGWQSAHPQEAAATPAATAQTQAPATPAPQPRLPAPTPAVAVPAAAPRAGESSGGWDWIAWLVGAVAALAALFVLRRRRPGRAPQPAQFIAASASEPVTAVSSPAPAPEPEQDEAAAQIRERLHRISRGSLDQELARRALLVDAFLDLKRYDSAERLLAELEQDLANSGEPRAGVANVAAAVRR